MAASITKREVSSYCGSDKIHNTTNEDFLLLKTQTWIWSTTSYQFTVMEHVEQNMLNNIAGWSQQNSDSRKLLMAKKLANPVSSTNKLHRRDKGWGKGKRKQDRRKEKERKGTNRRNLKAILVFPVGASGEEPSCQSRRPKRCRFNPWVRKIPWRRVWQPTPVFLPGKIPWTEEPGTGVHRVTKSHTLSDLACMEKLYNQLQTMDLISNKYSVKFSTRCDNCQIFESQNNHSILRSIYSYNFTRLQVSFQKSFCL